MTREWLAAFLFVQALVCGAASAHELRPAYLEIGEVAADEYVMTWKVPAVGDRRLALHVELPESCRSLGEKVGTFEQSAFFERWRAHCPGGLKGQSISIGGLRTSLTDVLARIEYRDGAIETVRLTPESPQFTFTGTQTRLEVARTYFGLGVEHILTGLDHLLFVLALMLLVASPGMLIKTITAFTVAHSLTLAGSALGYMSLPQQPVEAAIALSIVLVAREVVMSGTSAATLARTYPWLVAFAFGLLHGFGFAGALREIGLPHGDIPSALLFFNLGVEAGQLIFVGAMFALFRICASVLALDGARLNYVLGYGIGIVSTAWLISRIGAFGT